MSTCFAAYPESGKITVVDDFALATSYKVIYNGLPIVLVRGHRSRTRLVEVACHYLLFSLRIDGLVSSWADSNFSAASL